MDSSRGIPVEYKLDAFNMPRTGTTLCHPKIGYVDLSVIPLSTRVEITPTLPKYQTQNSRWHPKFNSYNCNMSFVKMQKTQSLTRLTTHAAITTFSTSHNSISSILTSLNSTSLAAPKANPIFHAANKNLFLKTPFDYRHTSSSSSTSFYFLTTISEGPYKLSEETAQHKHTYVTTIPRYQQQKLWLQNGTPSLNNNNHFTHG